MKLQSFEQTAAYYTKAADLTFTNGDVDTAVSHLRTAFTLRTIIAHSIYYSIEIAY